MKTMGEPDRRTERSRQDRRDRAIMLAITALSGVVIALVLYFAGAFTRSTG